MIPAKHSKIPTNIFEQSTDNRIEYLTLKTPGIPSFRLVRIPGGTFIMQEGEAKQTVILSPFYMAEFPVTQDLYEVVTGENPSDFKGAHRPVNSVSWYDSMEFCNLLSRKACLLEYYIVESGFRLPTEAEWEYAARGGNTSFGLKPPTYAGSNTLENVGWYRENSHSETKPAGLKFPNELGLFDMSGNEWEWCWDWYGAYETGTLIDPIGPQQGLDRVMRGGSWYAEAEWCAPVARRNANPGSRFNSPSFRVVFVA
jgi:formylglycine-generating enzyme required for sulfatase activity